MLNIPQRLEEKLKQSKGLYGGTLSTIDEFAPWISSNKLPFFPYYTDHGPTHLQMVLTTAEALIHDEAWAAITPQDAVVLVLSVLLHDSAMHLTPDGFVTLINPSKPRDLIKGFNDKPWPELWSEFMREARRFDSRKLTALFGDSEPVHTPPQNPMDMTLRDRLLIGEFLRRYHHRLAHEIALFGVPSPDPNTIRLQSIPDEIADLAGLVARSHGMPIRSCLPYLNEKYSNAREFQGVHAPFLMAVLRVADYLQIQSERAPKQLLRLDKPRSPVSMGEWNAHNAIRDIRNTDDDPEAIFIDAVPKDVATFLKIKDWLKGIQHELDTSWAVLGEVYGRYIGHLGLVIRRVRSNLDNETAFAKTVDYIPRKASFESAGADLLKLLVGPLYGDNPAVGIRELVQNAVDAVRERWELERQQTGVDHSTEETDWDVLVSLDEDKQGNWTLTVEDKGIGMTPEIVSEYFLKAGASFRRSKDWKDNFEDAEGHSKVLRSGRFGVGALAAFLLGSEIHVSTRHFLELEDAGIEFSATIQTDAIQMQRIKRYPGTAITIKLSSEMVKELDINRTHNQMGEWDWFCLPKPKVVRKKIKNKFKQAYDLPQDRSILPSDWHQIHPEGFEEVQWTYSDAPRLVCNGIQIRRSSNENKPSSDFLWSESSLSEKYRIKMPNLSVFDPDGHLPLTLQRYEVNSVYPFKGQLLEDVVIDILSFLLVDGPTQPLLRKDGKIARGYSQQYILLTTNFIYESHPALERAVLLSTDDGFLLNDPWNLNYLHGKSFVLVSSTNDLFNSYYKIYDKSQVAYFHLLWGDSKRYYGASLRGYISSILGLGYYGQYSVFFDSLNPVRPPSGISSGRILVREKVANWFMEPKSLAQLYKHALSEKTRRNGWVLWEIGNCPSAVIDFDYIIDTFSIKDKTGIDWESPIYAECYPNKPRENLKLSLLAEIWQKHIGKPFIPFDPKERKKIIAASPKLAEKAAKWEERKKQAKNETQNTLPE